MLNIVKAKSKKKKNIVETKANGFNCSMSKQDNNRECCTCFSFEM